jgi:hypothetical protein
VYDFEHENLITSEKPDRRALLKQSEQTASRNAHESNPFHESLCQLSPFQVVGLPMLRNDAHHAQFPKNGASRAQNTEPGK